MKFYKLIAVRVSDNSRVPEVFDGLRKSAINQLWDKPAAEPEFLSQMTAARICWLFAINAIEQNKNVYLKDGEFRDSSANISRDSDEVRHAFITSEWILSQTVLFSFRIGDIEIKVSKPLSLEPETATEQTKQFWSLEKIGNDYGFDSEEYNKAYKKTLFAENQHAESIVVQQPKFPALW